MNIRRACLLLTLLLVATWNNTQAEPDDPHFIASGSWGQGFPDQWGLGAIGFTDRASPGSAWHLEDGSRYPVIVALVDTGLDYFHPDLDPGSVWRNPGETPNGRDDDGNGYVDDLIGWNFVDDDNNPWDLAGHGTHIAGIIAAATNNGEGIAGINPGVRIMPLKVMNFAGRGRATRMAEAVFYAVDHGASVINLSLGAEHAPSETMRMAADYAMRHGALVVVAAGNSGIDTARVMPAGLDNVITVAASAPEGTRAAFSNFGDAVDITAPGVDVLSLRARRTDFALVAGQQGYRAGDGFVGTGDRYYRATGTSFAAPFVTGVASLLYARHPDISPQEVKRILLQTATDMDVPGTDRNTGYGLLDAAAALRADRGFFIEAHIEGVEVSQESGKPILRVLGTANADAFADAWIELGPGTDPDEWTRAPGTVTAPVVDGLLMPLDVNLLRGSKIWTLRVIARHRNGKTREARFQLNLG